MTSVLACVRAHVLAVENVEIHRVTEKTLCRRCHITRQGSGIAITFTQQPYHTTNNNYIRSPPPPFLDHKCHIIFALLITKNVDKALR